MKTKLLAWIRFLFPQVRHIFMWITTADFSHLTVKEQALRRKRRFMKGRGHILKLEKLSLKQEKKQLLPHASLPFSLSFIISDNDFVSWGTSSGTYWASASFSFSIAWMHSFTVDDLNLPGGKKAARKGSGYLRYVQKHTHTTGKLSFPIKK